MRKRFQLVISLMLVLGMTGCGTEQTNIETATSKPDGSSNTQEISSASFGKSEWENGGMELTADVLQDNLSVRKNACTGRYR